MLLIKILKKIIHYYNRKSTPNYRHGKRFYSNTHIDTLFPDLIEIGDNFISAPGSIITAHDASTLIFTNKYKIKKIKIGNNVFLGANAVILPGATIGDNVIIGAGSVVLGLIEPNSVYAGVPAKYLCSIDEYIEKLENEGCLYSIPKLLYEEYHNGIKFSSNSISELRSSVYNMIK